MSAKEPFIQILGHEDDNMALDVYSGGLVIANLRHSIYKLTYGFDLDLKIKKMTQDFFRASL